MGVGGLRTTISLFIVAVGALNYSFKLGFPQPRVLDSFLKGLRVEAKVIPRA